MKYFLKIFIMTMVINLELKTFSIGLRTTCFLSVSVVVQLFSLQLWVNSRTDYVLQPC